MFKLSPAEAAIQRAMVENVLARYAWAYDMEEMDLLGDCFAADAEVEFSTGWQRGRAAVVGELKRRRSKYTREETPWHVATNVFIRPESPERARVTSWWNFGAMARGAPMALNSFGWYDDRFILEDGEWRVVWRRVVSATER